MIAAAFATTAGEPVDRMGQVDLLTQLPDDLLFLTVQVFERFQCRLPCFLVGFWVKADRVENFEES